MSETAKELNEKGFIAILNEQAYLVRMWGERPWLFEWHEHAKNWMSLKALNQTEIWMIHAHVISDEQAEIYYQLANL